MDRQGAIERGREAEAVAGYRERLLQRGYTGTAKRSIANGPCVNGHDEPRSPSGACRGCHREAKARYRERKRAGLVCS